MAFLGGFQNAQGVTQSWQQLAYKQASLSSGITTTTGGTFNGGNYITYPLIYQGTQTVTYPALQQQPWKPGPGYMERMVKELQDLMAKQKAEPEEPCVSQEEIRANGGRRKIEV